MSTDDSNPAPVIIGIVVPIVVLFIVIGIIIVVLRRRKSRKHKRDSDLKQDPETPKQSMAMLEKNRLAPEGKGNVTYYQYQLLIV